VTGGRGVLAGRQAGEAWWRVEKWWCVCGGGYPPPLVAVVVVVIVVDLQTEL